MDTLTLDGAARIGGHTIRHGVVGPAGAPPLVLLHGTPFSSHVWHRVIPWLARHFRVHFHDMLGYGASAKPDADVSLGVQNGIAAALIDHWGLTAPHVIAHDFGGATALRMHLLDGVDFASLTLIDAVALRPWGSAFFDHVRAHEAAFAGLPPYIHDALVRRYIRTAIQRDIPDAELEPYVAPWTGPEGQPALYRQMAQGDQRYTDAVQARYGEVRCPVQVLWGEADGWVSIEIGRRLAGMLPDARFLPIPGAGHLVQEDAPEAILSAVADFPALQQATRAAAA